MSSPTADHPPPERLPAFGLGLLSAEESAAIERHVAECDACCRSLLTVADDALVSRLRQAASTSSDGLPSAAAPTQGLSAPGATTAPEPLPPELAAHPRYRVEQLLGAGGMGAVYRAWHRVLGRAVALKVINPALTNKAAAVERFARESRAAARLSHPNIVTAFDAEQAGGTHFLVMEYVEGTDLARLVAGQGPLPVDRACEYVRQAALGLQHAYEQGMVHRDVKPHNLMLTPEGRVKILDFGLARFASEAASEAGITGTGTVLGTVDYIAPEQADNAHQADVRADIYSLGCTLYHLLAGHPPFPTGTPVQRVMAHVDKTPRSLAELRQDLPEELMPVLERMMAKSPAARYQTPAEAAEALRPFTDPAALRRFRKAVPGAHPAPRRRRGALLAAALALLLLGGGLLGVVVYRVATDKGELVIESDSDEVEVAVSQGGRVVKIVDAKSGQHVTLRPGDYELALKDPPEGMKLSADKVTLRRGEKVLATVERVTNPRPQPNGPLLFQDNFDTPAPLATPMFGRGYMSFEHIRGEGVLTPRKQGVVPALYRNWKGADFYAEVDVRVPSPARDSGYGLLFRSADVADGRLDAYYALCLHPAQGKVALSCWQEPRWALRKEFPLRPGTFAARDANRLRLEAVGGDLRVFLNGGFVGRLTDHRLRGPGLLALCVGDAGDKAEAVYFANLRVYAPRPPEEKPGEVRRFEGHRGGVIGISYAPDGRHVLSTSYDGTVRLWDVASGKQVRRFEGHTGWPYAAVLSPDGRHVLSGGDDLVLRIWDAKTAKELRQGAGHTKGITWVAVSPDGRRALTASWDGTVRLWDVEAGEPLRVLEGHTDMVGCVAFSPDGRRTLSASGDKTVRLWDLEAGKEVRSLEGHTEGVTSVAFSPDGRRALSGGLDKTVRLWDVDTGKQVRCMKGHTSPVTQVAFAPDGRHAVSAASPVEDGEAERGVRGWDLETGKELYRLETRVAGRMAVSPDGRYALVSSPEHPDPRLWRLPEPGPEEKAGEVRELTWRGGKQTVSSTAFSPDGRYLLAGGSLGAGISAVWETATGKLVMNRTFANGAVFLPDSRHVLASGWAGQLVVWDPITDKEVRRFTPHRSSSWPSLSADGTRAVSYGGAGDPIVLWDVAAGKPLAEWQAGHDGLFLARLSPDGRRVASVGLKDRLVRLWDVGQRKVIRSWESKGRPAYGLVCFRPDGRSFLIAAEAGPDGGLALFDEQAEGPTWLKGLRWEGASGLSRAGRFALLSDGKTTVRGYDLSDGRELGRVTLPTDVGGYLAVSPDGRHGAAAGPRTGTIKGATRIYLFRLSDQPPSEKDGGP